MLHHKLITAACTALRANGSLVHRCVRASRSDGRHEAGCARQVHAQPARIGHRIAAGQEPSPSSYNSPSYARSQDHWSELVPYGEPGLAHRSQPRHHASSPPISSCTIGSLAMVPAGDVHASTHCPQPPAPPGMLIINKQTGQWGTVYKQDMRPGPRGPMKGTTIVTRPSGNDDHLASMTSPAAHTTEMHVKLGDDR